ncbi:MAG: YhbY family RNA-binding protein [Zoogloeaceae bacterium]|nr:YhbY family RNA-binding protein [Zoogloeaceae bacterium]
MPSLTPARRRALRAEAHHLDPVVSVAAKGLTPTVLAEIDRALTAHGLIKIRIYGEDRAVRADLMSAICAESGSEAVQHIGNILVIWREPPAPAVEPTTDSLPRPRRSPPGKSPSVAAPSRFKPGGMRPARSSAPRGRTNSRSRG